MDLTKDESKYQNINWLVTFFGGKFLIVSGKTAAEACGVALLTHDGEIYSVVAYPYYL